MYVLVNKIGESNFKSDKFDKPLMLYQNFIYQNKKTEICKATV